MTVVLVASGTALNTGIEVAGPGAGPGAGFNPLPTTATFAHHVESVISLRAKKQMVGANARRIVTVMADEHSFWNRAIVQFPRKTTDNFHRSIPASDSYQAIAHGASPTCPNPTGIGLVNLGPESVGEWDRLTGHRSSLLRCRAGGIASAARLSHVDANSTRVIALNWEAPPAAVSTGGAPAAETDSVRE